jgi:hypothetical protein
MRTPHRTAVRFAVALAYITLGYEKLWAMPADLVAVAAWVPAPFELAMIAASAALMLVWTGVQRRAVPVPVQASARTVRRTVAPTFWTSNH